MLSLPWEGQPDGVLLIWSDLHLTGMVAISRAAILYAT
jgi:hypothetical protein